MYLVSKGTKLPSTCFYDHSPLSSDSLAMDDRTHAAATGWGSRLATTAPNHTPNLALEEQPLCPVQSTVVALRRVHPHHASEVLANARLEEDAWAASTAAIGKKVLAEVALARAASPTLPVTAMAWRQW